MSGDAIDVQHLSRRFGSFVAVNDLSFSVKQGEIFGFLGANGAGKSTTIRMLCGLLLPTSGTAEVAGFDVATQAEQVRRPRVWVVDVAEPLEHSRRDLLPRAGASASS